MGAWTEARWRWGGQGSLCGKRQSPGSPQGGSGQGSPSECFWPERGPPDCQAAAPPALSHSPDLIQLIVGVSYFFPVTLTDGQKQVLSHQEPAPTSTHPGALSSPPPYLRTRRPCGSCGLARGDCREPQTPAGSSRCPHHCPGPWGAGRVTSPGGPNGAASSLWRICNSWLQPRLH